MALCVLKVYRCLSLSKIFPFKSKLIFNCLLIIATGKVDNSNITYNKGILGHPLKTPETCTCSALNFLLLKWQLHIPTKLLDRTFTLNCLNFLCCISTDTWLVFRILFLLIIIIVFEFTSHHHFLIHPLFTHALSLKFTIH